MKKRSGSMRVRRITADVLVHTILAVLSVIWLIPIVWLVLTSFRAEKGSYVSTFFPKHYTLDNYIGLLTETDVMNFPRMFVNTFVIAVFSCIISTFFVLSVAYCTSRLRFRLRKPYMNFALTLTLFPGFMSMMAVYFILKSVGLTEGNMIPLALIIVFSAGAGTQFYIMKGYMDTIPLALDEAAYLDGATRWQVFTRVTLPLAKPMIVYQVITAFLAPWLDFIFAKIIVRANSKYFTVSIGLWSMLEKEYVDRWYTRFAAGAVLVSIPIAILFLCMQKYYQEAMGGAVKG